MILTLEPFALNGDSRQATLVVQFRFRFIDRLATRSGRSNPDSSGLTIWRDMPTDPYAELIDALAEAGFTAQQQRPDQLIISAQQGPVWPNHGNSFWMTHKEGSWFLSTWTPVCYQVPADQDMVALCCACMGVGTSAMYRVPAEIVARFGLREIDDRQYERLFPTRE